MTAQSGRPPPPAPGAGAVATRSEPPMRPNYQPEHVEQQIHPMASSSTSSINNPPSLPPPVSIAKAPQSPPLPSPPTHTIPGSLPAGSRVPKTRTTRRHSANVKIKLPVSRSLLCNCRESGGCIVFLDETSIAEPIPIPSLPYDSPTSYSTTSTTSTTDASYTYTNLYTSAHRRRNGA